MVLNGDRPASVGAPGNLTDHRVTPDKLSNDSFLVCGHFDADGNRPPDKVVGWQGSKADRGAAKLIAGQAVTRRSA